MKQRTLILMMAAMLAAAAGTSTGQTVYAKTPAQKTEAAAKAGSTKKAEATNPLLDAKRTKQTCGKCSWLKVSITKKSLK